MIDTKSLIPSKTSTLTDGDFTQSDAPMALWEAWFAEAKKSEPADPNAMAVATLDDDGLPNLRMVLLKGVDARGFVFYTNTESQKGRELARHAKAALLFHWKSLTRQLRIRGAVERVSDAEADAYFASRPKLSQIGAWASQQSRPLESRLAFEKAVAVTTAKYALSSVPRPPHWTGFRVVPNVMEFWHDRAFRLHDRIEFRRDSLGADWRKVRLYP